MDTHCRRIILGLDGGKQEHVFWHLLEYLSRDLAACKHLEPMQYSGFMHFNLGVIQGAQIENFKRNG